MKNFKDFWKGQTSYLTKSEIEGIDNEVKVNKQDNPWAICHAQGLEGDKFERCVMHVKEKFGKQERDQFREEGNVGKDDLGPMVAVGEKTQDPKEAAREFEQMRDTAELKALSKLSQEKKLTPEQYQRMSELAKKLGLKKTQIHKADVHPSGITKDEFEAYVSVQESGVTNMLDVRTVGEYSGLLEDKIMKIIKEYSSLKEFYSKKAKMQKANVDDIIKWESGEMTQAEEIEFFQGLVDSGEAWRLQGVYGRQADAMLQAGVIKPPKDAKGTDYYGNPLKDYYNKLKKKTFKNIWKDVISSTGAAEKAGGMKDYTERMIKELKGRLQSNKLNDAQRAGLEKKIKEYEEALKELETMEANKAVDASFGGPTPKSGLTYQDLEGTTTKQVRHIEHEVFDRTEVHEATVGDKEGWAFSLYLKGRSYPQFVSALYKTKPEAEQQLQRYIQTGKFDTYGSAEKSFKNFWKDDLNPEIKEEVEGAAHYNDLAATYPEHSNEFHGMAADEIGHKNELEVIDEHLDAKKAQDDKKPSLPTSMLFEMAMEMVDDGMATSWPDHVKKFLESKGATEEQIREIIEQMDDEFRDLK
jgi:hypothetical protein